MAKEHHVGLQEFAGFIRHVTMPMTPNGFGDDQRQPHDAKASRKPTRSRGGTGQDHAPEQGGV